MIASTVLFLVHSAAHLVGYVLPRTLFIVLVKTPLTMVESCLGEQRSLPERDDVLEVTCHWWDKSTLQRFGLVEHGLLFPDPVYGGHLSTIFGALRPVPVPRYERSVIRSADGEEIHLDWATPSDRAGTRAVFLILPGLTSSSTSNYIAKFVRAALSKDFACCVLNARGVDDTPITRPQLLSAVWTTDLRSTLCDSEMSAEGLTKRFGTAVPVVAVGFSLGGAILSKYLGEEGKEGKSGNVAAAVTICAPWDMHLSANTMRGVLQRVLYQPNLVKGLRRYAKRHEAMVRQIPQLDASFLFDRRGLDTISTVQDFDRAIIAPHFGFDSPESYYTAATTLPQYLAHSPVPTLCIAALGDPVTGAPPLRRWEALAQRNKNIVYVAMPSGGHLGFVGGPIDEWWARSTNSVREDPMETLVLHSINAFILSDPSK